MSFDFVAKLSDFLNKRAEILVKKRYIYCRKQDDFANMRFDLEAFRREVYAVVAAIPRGKVTTYGQIARLAAAIPRGKVTTYGQIARLAGCPNHARLVGHVLRNTRPALRYPCHRVVNSPGRTVPHWQEQAELLRAEGVAFKSNGCVDMKACGWNCL